MNEARLPKELNYGDQEGEKAEELNRKIEALEFHVSDLFNELSKTERNEEKIKTLKTAILLDRGKINDGFLAKEKIAKIYKETADKYPIDEIYDILEVKFIGAENE